MSSVENVVEILAKYDFGSNAEQRLFVDEEKSLGILDGSNLEQISALNSPNCKLSTVVTFVFAQLSNAPKDTVSALFIQNPKAYETSLKLLEAAKSSHTKLDSEGILLFSNQVREAYAPFKTLPEEVWGHVFSSCDTKTLGRLECVSTFFHNTVSQSGWSCLALSLMAEQERKIYCQERQGMWYVTLGFMSKLYLKTGGWTLSEQEKALLETCKKVLSISDGAFIAPDLLRAFECMKNNTATAFASTPRFEPFLMIGYSNAERYLQDGVKPGSFLRQIISNFKEAFVDEAPGAGSQKEFQENQIVPKTLWELASGLEKLVQKIEMNLTFLTQPNPPANSLQSQ